jgi:hypothetical protein
MAVKKKKTVKKAKKKAVKKTRTAKQSDFDVLSKLLNTMSVPLCDESGSDIKLRKLTQQFARSNVNGYAQHADEEDGRKILWLPGDSLLFDSDGNFIAIEDSAYNSVFPKKQNEE